MSVSVIAVAADVSNPRSLSNRFRQKRFRRFESLCALLPRPLRIIDIGGTAGFWKQRGWANQPDVQILTVNLQAESDRFENIVSCVGEATNLTDIEDGQFDIAFSNSVIEHLFTFDNQRHMAQEVQRVASAYWVQTPNYWFPIEPHFHIPGWQWFPRAARIAAIRRRKCGHRGPYPDPQEAASCVDEVRLLTGRQMKVLFPKATLWAERVGGLVKSWVAHGGFPSPGKRGPAELLEDVVQVDVSTNSVEDARVG